MFQSVATFQALIQHNCVKTSLSVLSIIGQARNQNSCLVLHTTTVQYGTSAGAHQGHGSLPRPGKTKFVLQLLKYTKTTKSDLTIF